MQKIATIYFCPESEANLADLQKQLGLSRSGCVREAIKKLYKATAQEPKEPASV